MRDRLIELLCNIECKGEDFRNGGCALRKDERCIRIDNLDMCMIERIADNLLANGWIVPPCKVGDKVYSIVEGINFVLVGEVYEYVVGREHFVFRSTRKGYFTLAFTEIDIGKTVFLTREEAKKHLRKGARTMDKMQMASRLAKCFPRSFVNGCGEFIAHTKANQYFNLANCETELDVKCKVLEWFSRGAYKSEPFDSDRQNQKLHEFMLSGINRFLGTKFTEDDMETIYTYLGNCCNHQLTVAFVNSGYDMELLAERSGE